MPTGAPVSAGHVLSSRRSFVHSDGHWRRAASRLYLSVAPVQLSIVARGALMISGTTFLSTGFHSIRSRIHPVSHTFFVRSSMLPAPASHAVSANMTPIGLCHHDDSFLKAR